MTVTATRPMTLFGRAYVRGEEIPTETWDKLGLVHDRQRVLLSQHFVEQQEDGGVAVAAPPAPELAKRKRGRPKGAKDTKPRKRRTH